MSFTFLRARKRSLDYSYILMGWVDFPMMHCARDYDLVALHTSITSYDPGEVCSWILSKSSGGSFFGCTGK